MVTNTGNVTLHPVTVTDPMPGLSAVTCPDATLAPAAAETCTATYTTTQADVDAGSITNTGTATRHPPHRARRRRTPRSRPFPAIQTPAITIVKSASVASFSAAGHPITYSYMVTNTGNVTLHPSMSPTPCPACRR